MRPGADVLSIREATLQASPKMPEKDGNIMSVGSQSEYFDGEPKNIPNFGFKFPTEEQDLLGPLQIIAFDSKPTERTNVADDRPNMKAYTDFHKATSRVVEINESLRGCFDGIR